MAGLLLTAKSLVVLARFQESVREAEQAGVLDQYLGMLPGADLSNNSYLTDIFPGESDEVVTEEEDDVMNLSR